jgi:hypothetical protein
MAFFALSVLRENALALTQNIVPICLIPTACMYKKYKDKKKPSKP